MENLRNLLQRMIFIYNAVLSGWTVKYLGEDCFQFKQKRENIQEEIMLDEYLKKFIKDNLEGTRIKV